MSGCKIKKKDFRCMFVCFFLMFFLVSCGGSSNDNANNKPVGSVNNRAPVAEDATYQIEFNTSLNVRLTALDADANHLTYKIIQQPTVGMFVLSDSQTQTYRYNHSSENVSPQQVIFEVSDGVLKDQGTITLNIIDSSAPEIVSSNPEDKSVDIALSTAIKITFDDVMSDFPYQLNSSLCQGGVQISSDAFNSCQAISAVSRESNNKVLNIQLAQPLAGSQGYQIKVTPQATNFHGVAAEEKVIANFSTQIDDIKISEVSSSGTLIDSRWIELFNGTNRTVDLADYSIKTQAIDFDTITDAGLKRFSLPSSQLMPGEYLIVQSRFTRSHWQTSVASSPQWVFMGSGNDDIGPFWYQNGFVELLNKAGDKTVDFVRFGSNLQPPVEESHWSGQQSAPEISTVSGGSLIRKSVGSDSNSALDWQTATFMTPAGVNDVTCSDDVDLDGIPDCAEVAGSSFAGLPLYDWGARPGVKDIFIEVDYMSLTHPGMKPHAESMQKIVDVFSNKGYAVHFDAGSLYHPDAGLSVNNFDLGGGNLVPYYIQTTFSSSQTVPSIIDHKISNFDPRRLPIFHYVLMANSSSASGASGAGGIAEIPGNDVLMTMGSWNLSLSNEASRNTAYNFQAAMIMHEIGHNLGLRHGGDEDMNKKPNHLSVMNYLYAAVGLPTIGTREGDRYYRSFHLDNTSCNLTNNELHRSFTGPVSDFVIDYSSGLSQPINENQISESQGLGMQNSIGVDFNCNGNDGDTLMSYDVNGNGSYTDILNDFDEWSVIELRFTQSSYGAAGVPEFISKKQKDSAPQFLLRKGTNSLSKVSTGTTGVGLSANQELSKEESPGRHFFELLDRIQSN